MSLADASLTSLRVLRAVSEYGSLSRAAAEMGYTQSAISRQLAALERAAGCRLVERGRSGAALTPAGRAALGPVTEALERIDAATRAVQQRPHRSEVVRLGWFATAGAVIAPRALAMLRSSQPDLDVRGREGTTPSLVRALRAGTLDLALIALAPPYRAPDAESPPLMLDVLVERPLMVAVAATHHFASRVDGVSVADLEREAWISGGDTQVMGVWPGLGGRPHIACTARDWLAKLSLVASGAGITTVPSALGATLPAGVRLVRVTDGPVERRRIVLARRAAPATSAITAVIHALHDAVDGTTTNQG